MSPITREVTAPVCLCSEDGLLNPDAAAWSRQPWHVCNLRGRFPRKKRWDYWCVMGDRFLFSATIADVDYSAFGAIYFLDYATKRLVQGKCVMPPFRRIAMPDRANETVRFRRGAFRLDFDVRPGGIDMILDAPSVEGRPMKAQIAIDRPETHETLNVVIPWNARTYQFTSKQNTMPARGEIVWGDETFTFDPDQTYAVLDLGRGIWPYQTKWNWASFSGRTDGHLIGVNLGGRWTDGTGATENGLCVDGRLEKIFDDARFEYDPADFMRPWRLTTPESGAVDLTFTPFYEKKDHANLLILRASGHQCFGHISGVVRAQGREYRVEGLRGWAEEFTARW